MARRNLICAKGSRERTRGWFVMDAGIRIEENETKKKKRKKTTRKKKKGNQVVSSHAEPLFVLECFTLFLVACFLSFFFVRSPLSSLLDGPPSSSPRLLHSAPKQLTASSETASIPSTPLPSIPLQRLRRTQHLFACLEWLHGLRGSCLAYPKFFFLLSFRPFILPSRFPFLTSYPPFPSSPYSDRLIRGKRQDQETGNH